jgi:NAD(P)-dependent dehydrogenase (short-subunit alcohol dehydrogenase family)
MQALAGQVVVVTGAAGNLGKAVTQAFAQQGARLALLDRDAQRLEALRSTLRDPDSTATYVTNLLDAVAVATTIDGVRARFGGIYALANIAGGFTMGPPLHETPARDWELMLDLNLRSIYHMCMAVVPHMLAAGSGRIINVSARAARQGVANMGPYCAAKAAVITLTESLAAEHKHDGINVNCILPGTIDTPQNRAAMPDADHSTWVLPADLAEVVVFLAARASRAVTGAAIPVFGRS